MLISTICKAVPIARQSGALHIRPKNHCEFWNNPYTLGEIQPVHRFLFTIGMDALKNTNFTRSTYRIFLIVSLIGLLFSNLNFNTITPTSAEALTPKQLISGTVPVAPGAGDAILLALEAAPAVLAPDIRYFAITNVRDLGKWVFVSIIGFVEYDETKGWFIEEGDWFGLVLIEIDESLGLKAAVQGTNEFSNLLGGIPDDGLDGLAKQNLDPLLDKELSSQENTVFPWQPGTAMFYGSPGVQDFGSTDAFGAWRTVEFLSDGDLGAGHAPNSVLASQTATVNFICNDGISVAARIGNFFYAHLLENPEVFIGNMFLQGAEIGQLKSGAFSGRCGVANQEETWFRLRWGFPEADLNIEGWTLDALTQDWSDGSGTISPDGGWMTAGGSAGEGFIAAADMALNAPNAFSKSSPANGTTTPLTFTLNWNASAGATAYEYCYDTTNDNACTVWRSNGVSTSKSLIGLIRGRTYYWHVRARNADGVTYSNGSPTAFWSFKVASLPAAPALASPAANTVTPDTTPAFTWNSSANGNTYEVQIDDAATFSSPIVQSRHAGVGVLNYTATVLPEKVYYWRVRAYNVSNEAGAWSASRKITIDISPPLPPVLKAPADNSAARGTPTFSWNPSASAYRYRFAYDDSPNCPSPVYTSSELSTTSHKPPAMPLGTFHWCVRARDLAGNWSGWNPPRTVTILPLIPVAPALASPPAGAITSDVTPTFTWNPVPDGNRYEIQIDETSNFALPLAQTQTGAVGALTYTATALQTAAPSKTYYWRVRAINVNNEYGKWSIGRKLVIDVTPPLPPVPRSPSDNIEARGTPLYTWVSSVSAVGYQYQYDNLVDFSSPDYTSPELVSPSHKPPDQPPGIYYWRVRAKDAAGNWSPWSAHRKITILPLIPVAPVLVSPANGLVIDINTVTFTWNAVPYGNTYEIHIAADAAFTQNLRSRITGTGGLAATFGSFSIGKYYWRVRAINVNNEAGAWSLYRNFTISLGDDYYVSTTGNDANPGTFSAPWRTVQKAVNTLSAGDLVYVRGGQYNGIKNGWVFQHSGTQAQPITLTNYPGEQVIFKITTATRNDYQIFRCLIDPTVPSDWETPKADHIRIIGTDVPARTITSGVVSEKGIVILGPVAAQSAGITASDCDYWEVAGLDFVQTAYGIFTQKNNWHLPEEHSTDHWYVHDNRVYNYYRESGLQFNGNYNRIENNEIYKVSNQVTTPYGCQMLNLLGNNNIVRGNMIDRLGSTAVCSGILFEWDLADANLVELNTIMNVPLGIAVQGGDGNIIRNNHISESPNTTGSGILVASYDNRTSWPCDDYVGSGSTSEAILPPNIPTHPDYPYYFNPRNCHSMRNQVIENTIVGFEDPWVMYPVVDNTNIFSDNISLPP